MSSANLRYLLSFPTRRSSDLRRLRGGIVGSRRAAAAPAVRGAVLRRRHEYAVQAGRRRRREADGRRNDQDRKSTRLNSSHTVISYAVFCLKKKKNKPADKRAT